MDQSNALHRLLEAADLVKMIEDLTGPGAIERLSGASVSGLRITLRNVRESILASHDQLAGNFVNKSKAAVEARAATQESAPANITLSNGTATSVVEANSRSEAMEAIARGAGAGDPNRINLTRRDLRASLEKMVDR